MSRLDWRANGVPTPGLAFPATSSGPKRRLNAIWLSSSIVWPRSTSTEYASSAARISAKVASSTGPPASTPPISAANSGCKLVIVIATVELSLFRMVRPADRRDRRRPEAGRSHGPADIPDGWPEILRYLTPRCDGGDEGGDRGMDWRDSGFVLRARRHGESGIVAELLTAEHGRHAGLVRGGQMPRRRALLQPGNRLAVTWRGRLAEHLGAFECELLEPHAARLLDDPDRLAALG